MSVDLVLGSLTFDRSVAAEAAMDDLDLVALAKMLNREIDEQALLTLELAKYEGSQLKPTNAGVLVAGRQPQRFFPHAWVQCARFRGEDGLDLVDQDSIYGPLPLAVDKTMAFLQKHRFLHARFGEGDPNWDWRRKDISSIPEDAIRELVINALVHSSYSYGGSAIKVAFFDQVITVESPGGLLPGVTLEQVTNGVSVLRNPAVARVFRELGLIEAWGMGLRKVIRDLQNDGFGAPDFEELHERLRVKVYIPNHDPRYYVPVSPQTPEVTTTENNQNSGSESKDPVNQLPSKRSEAILRHLLSGPASRAELFAAIGIHNDHRGYLRHITPLLEQGLITMTNPENPTSPNQKYQLTPTGKTRLAA